MKNPKEKAECIINNINNTFENYDHCMMKDNPYDINNRKNKIIADIDSKIKILELELKVFQIIWWKKVKKYVIQYYDIKYQRKLKIEKIKNNLSI